MFIGVVIEVHLNEEGVFVVSNRLIASDGSDMVRQCTMSQRELGDDVARMLLVSAPLLVPLATTPPRLAVASSETDRRAAAFATLRSFAQT